MYNNLSVERKLLKNLLCLILQKLIHLRVSGNRSKTPDFITKHPFTPFVELAFDDLFLTLMTGFKFH